MMGMKILIGSIILVDLAFFLGCLFMPRSGMEAMGAVFILIPLAGLHLLAGIAACFLEMRRERWKFPVYFALSTGLILFLGYLYGNLEPTYRPLHRVLLSNALKQKDKFADFRDRQILMARRLLERWRDPDHAELCRAVQYPVDVDRLAAVMAKKPNLSSKCAQIRGTEALPLQVILANGYEPWRRGKKEDRKVKLKSILVAVDLLLAAGADPNRRDDKGNTALHWSLGYEDETLVSLLIRYGGCVYLKNDEGRSAMTSYMKPRIKKIIREAAEDPKMILNCPQVFKPAPPEKTDKLSPPATDRSDEAALWTQGLFRAVQSGNIDQVVTRLSEGADPNGTDSDGRRPLHRATRCRKATPAIVEILLTAGADINARDRKGATPLMSAVRNHCPDIVSILIGKGADPNLADRSGSTAMHLFARWQADKMLPVIDGVLDAGAKIDPRDKHGRTPLMMTVYASRTGDEAAAVFLAKGADPNAADRRGNTLAHLLAFDSGRKERVEGVARIIEAGASIDLRNKDQMTPLMLAVKRRKVEIAKQLLKAGASPNVASRRGTPVLHNIISCQPEKLKLLDILIAAGGEVDRPNENGQTALHRAMLNHLYVNCLAPVERLLKAGADPNILDNYGAAPLHNMSHWERKNPAEALKLMLAFGADVDIRDHQGLTPLLRAARFSNHTGVIQALLDAGATADVTDKRGNNLLHSVAMNRTPGAYQLLKVAMLVNTGLDARNKSGRTPFELALKYGNDEVAQEIKEKKNRTNSK